MENNTNSNTFNYSNELRNIITTIINRIDVNNENYEMVNVYNNMIMLLELHERSNRNSNANVNNIDMTDIRLDIVVINSILNRLPPHSNSPSFVNLYLNILNRFLSFERYRARQNYSTHATPQTNNSTQPINLNNLSFPFNARTLSNIFNTYSNSLRSGTRTAPNSNDFGHTSSLINTMLNGPNARLFESFANNPNMEIFTTTFNLNNLEPVTVRPTEEQIESATTDISFSSINAEDRYNTCPITHELFTDSSTVRRVNSCGHYFNPTALNTWFESNVTCPVCMRDIRDDESSQDASGNSVDDYIDNVMDNIMNNYS